MNKLIIACVAFYFALCGVFAQYVITNPQPLARGLTEAQLEAVIAKAPTNATVTLPAHLVASKKADIQTNVMLEEFKAIIADTRKNIPECKNMSDFEIAALYIQQMTKKATDIKVGTTNTIERIIGAGMREDIKEVKNVE